MSGGSTGGSSTTSVQLDPDFKAGWLDLNQAAKDTAAKPYAAYDPAKMVAGDNMFEDLAQYRTLQSADMGQGAISQAQKVLGGVAEDSPVWMDAQLAGPAAPRSAAQIGDVLDVSAERAGTWDAQAGSIPSTSRDPYMNPFVDEVVNRSISDIDRQRQMALVDNSAAATAAGAFGGSRHGVVDSLTNEAAMRQAGDLSAQLRAQGFDVASGLMTADADRAAQASAINAGAKNTASMFNVDQINSAVTGNAERDLAAREADAQARQQAMLAGADATDAMSQFDATQRQQTQQDYGARDLAQSELNIKGAQGLLGAADQEQAQYQRGADALRTAGLDQRSIDQQKADASYQQFLRQQGDPLADLQTRALPFNIIPSTNNGGTTSSNGKSKGFGI